MILSANDEMFSTSKTSKSSALLSVRLLLHISESVFLTRLNKIVGLIIISTNVLIDILNQINEKG